MDHEWGLSRTQANRYINKANEALIEECSQDRQLYASRLIHGLMNVQKEAIKTGNLQAANQAIAQLAKITHITS